MKSSPSTYSIEISPSNNNGNREVLSSAEDEANIEVSIRYKSITAHTHQDTSENCSFNRMDPYYDYRSNPLIDINDKADIEKKSNNEFSDESNPADCSTILSECFSGEDTAEVTTTSIAKGLLVVDSIQQQLSFQLEDDNSNIDVQVSPSPIRYFKHDNKHDGNCGTTSGTTTPLSPSSKLITKRYPKDPTTTPNRPLSSYYMVPSMTIGTKHTTWDHEANNAPNIDSIRQLVEPIEANTSSSHDVSSPSVQQKSNESGGEGKYLKEGDDDDGDDDDDEEEELSWRMNPNKSMSDWTIEIQTKKLVSGNNTRITAPPSKSNVYYVHKSVLAVGPRRSQYFVKLFRSLAAGVATTTETTTTVLVLDELTATAFPILLDYMYGTSTATPTKDETSIIPITTYNATALHVLAQQLEMKHLRTMVRNFWMQDLSMENIATYYRHASSSDIFHNLIRSTHTTRNSVQCGGGGGGLDDPLIIRALEMYCAQHMFDVDSGNCTIADILDILDPQFLYNVISQAHDNNEKYVMMHHSHNTDKENTFSLRLSLIVAVYCNIHYETDLDKTMFQQLTDRRHLPVLESQAARVFLELQEKLLCEPNTTVTSLTDRCISVLANHWDEACIKKPERNVDSTTNMTSTVALPRLQSMALESFVSRAFINATERINAMESRNAELQHRNVELTQMLERTQMKVATLEHENNELQRQLRELRPIKTDDAISDRTPNAGPQSHSSTQNDNRIHGVVVVAAVEEPATCVDEENVHQLMETDRWHGHDHTSQQQQQQQQQQRTAIDQGRLLLQRLDTTSTVLSTR